MHTLVCQVSLGLHNVQKAFKQRAAKTIHCVTMKCDKRLVGRYREACAHESTVLEQCIKSMQAERLLRMLWHQGLRMCTVRRNRQGVQGTEQEACKQRGQ